MPPAAAPMGRCAEASPSSTARWTLSTRTLPSSQPTTSVSWPSIWPMGSGGALAMQVALLWSSASAPMG